MKTYNLVLDNTTITLCASCYEAALLSAFSYIALHVTDKLTDLQLIEVLA